jgi:flavin reductase (DIM6/NTAB) family NADH-FMN oxidoreductase RutF
MTMDPDTFRAVLGRFATGVTVVTATDAERQDHGMTVSAFCSLSLTPPLVLVCIDRTASMHGLLQPEVAFAVNILSAGQEAVSRRFSTGDPPNRFDGLGYTRGQTGVPLLDDVLAWLECRVVGRNEQGDHTVVIGRVETAGARQERPLLYYRGGYATLER